MDFNKFLQSKIFKILIGSVAALIILLFVFRLGIMIGYRKASFSYRWGENYHKNFGGPRGGFLFFSDDKDNFISSNGAVGQIIKIDSNTLIVKDRDNVEKAIIVKEDTTILRLRDKIKFSDLKVDDFIVVIGNPNNIGQVEAKIIRIIPSPPFSSPRETRGSLKLFLKPF